MDKPAIRGLAASMCIAFALPNATHAEITWNGFVSVGGGIADVDEGGSILGYEEDFTFDNDTVLGLQLRAPISEKLSATGQLVARGNEDFEVDMAWAYLSYAASDDLTLRLGRFRTPFYLYSDFLEVGYAYHWIAPPDEVYSIPYDSINGVDAVYNFPIGPLDSSLQVYFGSEDNELSLGDETLDLQVRNQVGLVLNLNYDWLTFRASHHEAQSVTFGGLADVQLNETLTLGDATADLNPANCAAPSTLVDTLRCLSLGTSNPGYATAANELSVDEIKFSFDEVALRADWNNLLAVAEFTQLSAESGPVDTQNRMLATLGYRFGSIMVHITHSNTDDDVATISSTIPTTIPTLEATSMQLAGAVDSFANELAESSTTNSIGLRWDFEPGAAFKVEYSDVEDDQNSDGSLLRFAVDAVF